MTPEKGMVPVRFSGDALEYFGIWIVNFLLSAVTLGVYSAWAKVRNRKYLLRNVTIDGRAFDYHARGRDILVGRCVAVAMIGNWLFALFLVHLPDIARQFLALLPFAALPWLINRHLRFNAAMTSWSNVRFRFCGTYWRTFALFLLFPIVAAFTLFLAAPSMIRGQVRYVIGEFRLGGARFAFDGGTGPFVAALVWTVLWVIGVLLLSAFFAQVNWTLRCGQDCWIGDAIDEVGTWMPEAVVIGLGISLFTLYTVFHSCIRNAFYAGLSLEGGHRLESRVSEIRLVWISVSNAVLVVASLGMLLPWTQVRLIRYLCAHTWMHPAGSLDGFVSEGDRPPTALGDAFMEIADSMPDLLDGPQRTLAGEAYARGSSRRVAAHLDVRSDDRRVDLVDSSDGRVLASEPVETVRCERRLGSFPAAIRFPSGWLFLSPDHDRLCAVFGSVRFGRLHHWEAVRPRLVLFAALALATGLAAWRWGIAALVAVALALTPDAVPPALDRFAFGPVSGHRLPARLSESDMQAVREILDRLTPEAHSGNYRLVFRRSPESRPNAFAYPGGTIVVEDDFVRSFPDPDVIAGMLAHEIAHIDGAHTLKRAYGSAGAYLLVQFAFGNVGPVLENFLRPWGGHLLFLAHSRKYELEADRIGAKLAAEAGFDPAGLAQFLERVRVLHDDHVSMPAWMSTHPSHDERISLIRNLAKEFSSTD